MDFAEKQPSVSVFPELVYDVDGRVMPSRTIATVDIIPVGDTYSMRVSIEALRPDVSLEIPPGPDDILIA